jgi:hypothetical protein
MKAFLNTDSLRLLVGCHSTSSSYFKPDLNQQQFQRDIWECQQIVNQSFHPPQQSSGAYGVGAAIGYMIGRAMSKKGRHRDCMYGRGYQLQQ